jgi:hypothetical protein
MPIWLIQILVGVVLSVAGQLFSATSKQDQKQKVSGVRGTLQSGGDLSPRFVLGRYGTAGQLRYAGTWGNDGEVPNAYYSKVIEVSCLPIRGFSAFFVNGEKVTLAGSKTGNLGYAVLEYRVNGKDHLWINPYTGAQTAEDPLMLSKFGSATDKPYAGMVGRGCGYFVATALVNRELFSGFPEYLAEVDGITLDDPRGGTAQHDNPIVAAYTILRGISYAGEWVYGPQGYTAGNFRAANLAAEADKCDAFRAGTSVKRYRVGLDVALDEEPHAVIGELLKACAGRWADLGGVYRFLVGDPGSAVVSVTDEDMVITDQQTFEPFPGLEDLHNAMVATYPEPAEAWEMKEAPPRYRSDLEATDDGRRLVFSTQFKAVPWAVQVQDLMRTTIEDARRFRRHTQTMPPEFWEYEPLDVVSWTSIRNGYVAKSFLITVMDDLPNANQFVGWQEIDPDDYGWDSDYELPVELSPLVIARPAPQVTTGFTAAPYVVVDDNGADRRAAIEVLWDAGLVDVRAVRVQVRESWDDKAVVADVNIDYDVEEVSPSRVVANPAILSSKAYEVRGIYLPHSGRVTRWSNQDVDGTDGSWISVTTPYVPEVDVTDIQVAQLGKELQAAHGLVVGTDVTDIPGRLAELQAYAQQLALAVMDFNATAKETLNILSVQNEGAVAAVIRNEKAIVEESRARAEALTEVLASLDDVIAGGFLKFEAEVNELASTATITAKVRATSGSDLSEAAWILRAEADGLGGTEQQFGVLGDFHVFESVNGPAIPVFSATPTGVRFNQGEFRLFQSIAKVSGVPRIYLNGDTGDWRLGV